MIARSKITRWISALILINLPFTQILAANQEAPVDSGATAWMLVSTALVLLMVPGLAMFYGGLVRTKNVLGTIMHCYAAMGIMTVLWVLFGYSMCFGPNVLGGWFGWNSDFVGLKSLDTAIMDGGVPEYVFSMFQAKFAIITPALIAGAFAERVNFKAYCLFIGLWGILIYNPLCHWVWAEDGFLFNMGASGAIDFAGGTVVHISAGISGLVAALYLGARRGYPKTDMPPSNLVMTMIGGGLLWVGWFGFNAGSSITSGLSTAQALTATQVAAASGALCWMIIEGWHQGKATALGLVSGILAGLVAVTPAAGVVQPMGAMMLGLAASALCYAGLLIKNRLGYDDSLDAFGIHGVGGIVGAILLVFFIRDSWMADAAVAAGGSWTIMQQLGIQIAAVVVALVYAGVGTLGLLWLVNKIIKFRAPEEKEMQGLDSAYHGESGYGMLNPN
ncbi:MAG: ammonium transporter [Saprospiraceae bacterium]|nr:ammonium transporter [Saprospiraceae bacterium]